MVERVHLFGIIILSLIVMFSIIHLGVSIGIIATNKSFGNIFRPETGLASFNIVIAVLGFAVGIAGIISFLTNRDSIGKIVAIVSGVLGIFAFFSLITALVINSKSATFVNTRLFEKMSVYANNSGAQKIIDRIQNDYKCCGGSSWLDWGQMNFEPTSTTIRTIATTISSGQTTSSSPGNITITTSPASNITTTSSNATITTPAGQTATISAEDTTTPPAGETTMIPTEDTTTSLAGETTNTPVGETMTHPAAETTTRLDDEGTVSPVAETTNTPVGDTMTPPTAETTTRLGDESTALQIAETTTRLGDESTAPLAGETTIRLGDENTASPAAETTNTPVGESTAPLAAETTIRLGDETTALPIAETSIIPIEGSTAPSAGETTTVPTEETTAPLASEVTTISATETDLTPSEETISSLPEAQDEATVLSTVRRRIQLNNDEPSRFFLSAVRRRRRRRRQEIISFNRNLFTVPYYSTISVPNSCCPSTMSNGNNSSQATCTSSKELYASGCVRSLIKRANNQDMGIAIINCFMILLASTAVPFLLFGIANADVLDRRLYRTQVETMRHFDENPGGFPTVVNTFH